MNDDRFKELMERYVDSTKRGKDIDLQKLKNRSEDEPKKRRRASSFVWGACTILIVVIVSLSVALPIILNKEGVPQEEPQYYYCDNSQIEQIEISGIDEIKEKYNFNCMLPSLDYIESFVSVMTYEEHNQNIGAFIELSIFDENFDSITFNVIKKPYIMVQLQYFDSFTNSVKWQDTSVKYMISNENNDSYYSYAMTFTIGEYSYFINFKSFNEMSVIEALDMIYVKK